MLDLIELLHQICQTNILEITPEKSFYILLTVHFLGNEIDNNTIKPIFSKVDGIHKLTSRERPKSAPYLRLKIQKGDPSGFVKLQLAAKNF